MECSCTLVQETFNFQSCCRSQLLVACAPQLQESGCFLSQNQLLVGCILVCCSTLQHFESIGQCLQFACTCLGSLVPILCLCLAFFSEDIKETLVCVHLFCLLCLVSLSIVEFFLLGFHDRCLLGLVLLCKFHFILKGQPL